MQALRRLMAVAILSCVSLSCRAQSPETYAKMQRESQAAIDALANAPKPKAQSDLDTYKLASAHRERAESVAERTNGLWQSWLVSICEGCGPSMLSYKDRGLGLRSGWENARNEAAPTPKAQETAQETARARRAPPRKFVSLADDLSTENIDQIRRRPAP